MCVNCVIYVLIVYETDWKVEIWAAWSPRKHLFSMAREQAGENRLVLFSAACSPVAENRPKLLSAAEDFGGFSPKTTENKPSYFWTT
jgi:hypothetical protein